jgi:hypothetical protein
MFIENKALSPLRGLLSNVLIYPRLAPWATFLRRSAAVRERAHSTFFKDPASRIGLQRSGLQKLATRTDRGHESSRDTNRFRTVIGELVATPTAPGRRLTSGGSCVRGARMAQRRVGSRFGGSGSSVSTLDWNHRRLGIRCRDALRKRQRVQSNLPSGLLDKEITKKLAGRGAASSARFVNPPRGLPGEAGTRGKSPQ